MTINFSFQHQYPSRAIGGFSLDIQEELPSRGLTAIFGESGCGKTSLLRLIAGLEKTNNGRMNFNEQVWQDETVFVPPHKRSIAYVFQETSLFEHLSVKQNLNFAAKRSNKPYQKHLFDEVVHLLEISALLNSNSRELSGGEKQRVAIARSILSQPDLFLMDEPLSALDQRRKQEFLPYLENLKRNLNLPILYVTHSVNEVMRLADNIFIMDSGRKKALGNVKTVLQELNYKLNSNEGPSTLIEGYVAETQKNWGLTTIQFSGGKLFVTSDQIIPNDKEIRFQIFARDVSIALSEQPDTSIQNKIKCSVSKIQDLDDSHCIISLTAGDDTILANLTRKSVHDLNLRVHQEVFAQIKSVAIVK